MCLMLGVKLTPQDAVEVWFPAESRQIPVLRLAPVASGNHIGPMFLPDTEYLKMPYHCNHKNGANGIKNIFSFL